MEMPLYDYNENARFLPAPLAVVITEYANLLQKVTDDSMHYAALHRMCDAVEIMLRFFSSVLFAEILKNSKFPPGIRSLLVSNIEHPTMGQWVELLRETCRFLKEDKRPVEFQEIFDFTSSILLKEVEGNFQGQATSNMERMNKAFLPLRNHLAHSGRLGDSVAKKLHESHRPRFTQLCRSLEFLKEFNLLAIYSEGVYSLKGAGPRYEKIQAGLQQNIAGKEGLLILCGSINGIDGHPEKCLDIFPLAHYSKILSIDSLENIGKQEKHFQIYSRAKKEFLEYTILSDPDESSLISKTDDDSFRRFKEIFCLEEWKKEKREEESRNLLSNEFSFSELVNQLTNNFVGREKQLEILKKWVKGNNSGVCWVKGLAGMGKSALMAKLLLDLKGSSWGLFSNKKADPQKFNYVLVPYFFRAGDHLCREIKFLECAAKTIQICLQKMGLKSPSAVSCENFVSKDVKEYRKIFKESVKVFSGEMQRVQANPKKLIFLIDGLDEITQMEPSMINLPFEHTLPWVQWICSSREKPEKTIGIQAAQCEMIFGENGLSPLSEKEIYSFLINMTDLFKYGLIDRDTINSDLSDFKNPFIDVVSKRSEGLPIYLSYLVEDIRSGKMSFNDEKRLPEKLEDYYDQILDRVSIGSVQAVITPVTILLTLAKEPLHPDTMKFLLRFESYIEVNESLVDEALKRIGIILFDLPIPSLTTITDNLYGKTLYHNSCREHFLKSLRLYDGRLVANIKHYPGLRDCFIDYDQQDLSDITFCYAIRHLPAHLIDTNKLKNLLVLNPPPEINADKIKKLLKRQKTPLNALVELLTEDNFVYWKAYKADLLYDLIDDYARSLDEILSSYAISKEENHKILIVSLLSYDFPSLAQLDQKELIKEVWFEYAADTLAAFYAKDSSTGKEILDFLFKYKDQQREQDKGQNLNLSRLSLRAAELNRDYDFLMKALEYESANQLASGENIEESGEEDENADLPYIHRLVVDSVFLVARQDIENRDWEHLDLLMDILIASLDDIFQLSEKQNLFKRMAAYFNIAKQRKLIILRIKSVLEVGYKIFINYPQNDDVLQRLNKVCAAAVDIIIGLKVEKLLDFLVVPVYKLVEFKWNKVSDNAKTKKSIEEMFTVKSKKQENIIKDFIDLILCQDYEKRDQAKVFSSLVEAAFCSGLVSSSDEMFSINRSIHGHLLYHMHKFFPKEFREQYISKFFLKSKDEKGSTLINNFKEQISKYCPGSTEEDNLERARGMYEMLVRSLTYEAMETDNPEEILNISEKLVRYIIDNDLGLFLQEYNIVGRQLHILTAAAIAEARVEEEHLPRTVKIIKDLRDGELAPGATEAERWEGVSKCYFDLFYAGIFKVKHVLNSFSYLVDLKSAARNANLSNPGSMENDSVSFFKPSMEDAASLFMAAYDEKMDERKAEAMRKAAGRFAMVMIGLSIVNRASVQEYLKNNEVPETIWRKIKKWSIFMEKCYPAPSKKILSAEKMVEKYYEQLALGLFTNIIIIRIKEVRTILKKVFQQLLDAKKGTRKKETIKKDYLLKILKNIIQDVFDAMQKNSKTAL